MTPYEQEMRWTILTGGAFILVAAVVWITAILWNIRRDR